MTIAKKSVLALVLLAAAAFASQAQQLTGITVFTTDLNGNITGNGFFNTFGGDMISNIYVINDPVAQTYYNSGDSGGAGRAHRGQSHPRAGAGVFRERRSD